MTVAASAAWTWGETANEMVSSDRSAVADAAASSA